MEMGTMKKIMDEGDEKCLVLPSNLMNSDEEVDMGEQEVLLEGEEEEEAEDCKRVELQQMLRGRRNFCDKNCSTNGTSRRKRKRRRPPPPSLPPNQVNAELMNDDLSSDVPMDLSRRSTNKNGPEEGIYDTVKAEEEPGGEKSISNYVDEPLNLSVNGHKHSTTAKATLDMKIIRRNVLRLPPCARNELVEERDGAVNNSSIACCTSELLQKRVRLERMVSYIRRCSSFTEEGGGGGDGLVEDEKERLDDHNKSELVRRSNSCSQLESLQRTTSSSSSSINYRRRKKNNNNISFKDSASLTNNNGKRRSFRPYNSNGNQCGKVSYPVLRQQLLSIDVPAHVSRASKEELDVDEGEENEEDEDEDEEIEEDEDGEEMTEHDEAAAEDESDSRSNGCRGDVFRRQLRLVSLPSSPTSSSCLPWSAYAYYANILQELQQKQQVSVTPSAASPECSGGVNSSTTRSGSPLPDNGAAPLPGTPLPPGESAASLRKRAPRALTGKHVKHGTGASPATLMSLRQKIEQRRMQQRLQEEQNQKDDSRKTKSHHHNSSSSSSIKMQELKSKDAAAGRKLSKITSVTSSARKKIST